MTRHGDRAMAPAGAAMKLDAKAVLDGPVLRTLVDRVLARHAKR